MDYTTMIQNKMSKVKSSINELNSEIATATKYLQQLKESSASFVRNLNNISTPTTYLEEFMMVNSFLLKSISFLTEFNCKLEMLGITKKSVNSMIPMNKVPSVGVNSTSILQQELKCEPVEKSQSSKGLSLEKGDQKKKEEPVTIALENQSQKGRKKKKKKSKPQLEPNTNNISDAAKINASASNQNNGSKKNNNLNNSVEINDGQDSSFTVKGKQKNNSNVPSKSRVLDEKNNFQVVESPKKFDVRGKKLSNSQTKEMSGSEMCLSSSSTVFSKEHTNQISFHCSCNSSVANVPNSASKKVSCEAVQACGNIPVAGVVPAKIKDWWDNSKEYFNCAENSDNDNPKASKGLVTNECEIAEIKPANLVRNLGEEYDVVIEHIKSPSEFYVRTINTEQLLLELEAKLNLIPANKNNCQIKNNKLDKAMLSEEIGKYGLVYLKCDETWCRAEITDWCLNYTDDFVNVFLLDYGESKCVPVCDLQTMPKYLKQYPAFAVRCHLHDVFPVDMDKENKTFSWEKESSEKMKSLTENSTSVRIKIAPNDCFHPASSLPVTLWLNDQGYGSVNELLVSSKHAIKGSDFEKSEGKSEILQNNRSENDDLNKWHPMKEDYESYKNSYDLDINDPSAIIYGYVGKDYEKICKHFANKGYCFKGDACRKEHKKLDHLGFTTDQEEIYRSAINALPIPPPKSKLNVQVTCVLNCNKFYCFPESTTSSPNEENLRGLLTFMNQEENVLKMKKLLIPPSPGQIVIACYSRDKSWYRARVLECQPENDQYSIVYVDYGNKETLTLASIRAIEPRYLHLPFQAIECSIFGIEQNSQVPLEKVINFMNERMDDGHITIEVIARLPGEDINLLVNVFDSKGVNIGTDLVTKNYAVPKDEMIVSSASESVPG